MKVLREGNTKQWKKEIECEVCETLLEIEMVDLFTPTLYKLYSKGFDRAFKCPRCEHVQGVESGPVLHKLLEAPGL